MQTYRQSTPDAPQMMFSFQVKDALSTARNQELEATPSKAAPNHQHLQDLSDYTRLTDNKSLFLSLAL